MPVYFKIFFMDNGATVRVKNKLLFLGMQALSLTLSASLRTAPSNTKCKYQSTRGLQLANKCLLVAAVCYNLKRLLKWMGEDLKKLLWLLLVQHGRTHRLALAVSS